MGKCIYIHIIYTYMWRRGEKGMRKETQIYPIIFLWLKSCPPGGIPYIIWAIFKCIFKQYWWLVTHAYTLLIRLPGFYHSHMWTLACKMKAVIIYFSAPASRFDSLHNNTSGGQLTFFFFVFSALKFLSNHTIRMTSLVHPFQNLY